MNDILIQVLAGLGGIVLGALILIPLLKWIYRDHL